MPKFLRSKRKGKRGKVVWNEAEDIQKRVAEIIELLKLDWIDSAQIHTYRSENSKTRAYARIWGLSRIWQKALKEKPSYVIEVISEKFDNLERKEQDRVLLHEITHIPKTFSGALVPHYRKGKRNFDRMVRQLVAQYEKDI